MRHSDGKMTCPGVSAAGEWSRMCTVCQTLLAGFACNYLPYFVIDHTFFLHHYLPAYVFAVMLAACTVDHLRFVAK